VEKGFVGPHKVRAGASVHVLFYQEAKPHVVSAKVNTLTPMALTTKDPGVKLLEPEMRSIIVAEENGSVSKAECKVTECKQKGEEWDVKVDVTSWEELDRRRYPRHKIEVPIRMRLVREDDGNTQIAEILAVTQDISLGGMLIKTSDEVPEGSLVEVQAALRPKEHIRVLAVVVRALDEQGTFGLEFLDFVGGSRYAMHGFLTEAA
jgi:c-di-GMP-binding flagellar brake protein YcgR